MSFEFNSSIQIYRNKKKHVIVRIETFKKNRKCNNNKQYGYQVIAFLCLYFSLFLVNS